MKSTEDLQTITVLVRPASINKPEIQRLADKGVDIIPIELDAAQEELVKALAGQDTLVSCLVPFTADMEIGLANAAKAAGIKRFVPSAFATPCPPRGVMELKSTVVFPGFHRGHHLLTNARNKMFLTTFRRYTCRTRLLTWAGGIKVRCPDFRQGRPITS